MTDIGVRMKCFLIFLLLGMTPLSAEETPATLPKLVESLREKFPEVPTITTAQLATILEKESPILLDVREEKEYAVSHLPGAHRAAKKPEKQLEELGAKANTPIVLYCSVGYRSSVLARDLAKKGFTNVRNLEGSIFAWANENRPLESAKGKTEGVHPFDKKWGGYVERNRWQWQP